MGEAPVPVDTVVLEATFPASVDWSRADVWRVIVTERGVPCSAFWLPGPGRLRDPAAFTELQLAAGRARISYERMLEQFEHQLAIPEARPPRRSCSVIVCTHRRSAYLSGLLEALGILDPAPDEVIVVDNDPGDLDCREVVEAAGARYVREDRRGLDNARNAGLRLAGSDLVAFTDDDCIPSRGWLAGLAELFEDPLVGAVTGPAFAHELRSPAQVRFEREGGFTRGRLRRRSFHWTTTSPLNAGAAGAGASMVFRRDVLDSLHIGFPPELDAGTPTESGGDTYALYKVLAAGWRVVYDPGTYVFHRHRRDPQALHRAFFGYGVGLSATMAKVLVEEREPEAIRAWWWLVSQYRAAQRRRLLGRTDAAHVRVAWDYVRGGLHGPVALLRARAAAHGAPTRRPHAAKPGQAYGDATGSPPRGPGLARGAGSPAARRPDRGAPAVSVIVPTVRRSAELGRCLAALAVQDVEAPFEIIVVDDDPKRGIDGPSLSGDAAVRVIRGGGQGAAAARNAGARDATGDVLLFLDDDLVPAPDLVRRHLTHHRDGADRIVIGRCPPRPPRASLADVAVSLWWEDRYREMERSGALTFTDVLSGNMSVRRTRFIALGGFDRRLGTLRREDWHWGIHALSAGVQVDYDRNAIARHEFVLTPARRLAAAFAEGRGDAFIAQEHPEFAHALPAVEAGSREIKQAVVALALRFDRSRGFVLAVLDALERLRLRRLWLRLYDSAQVIEYRRGRAGVAAGSPPGLHRPLVVAPDGDGPLPPPAVCAPPLRLRVGGEMIGVTPEAGRWNARVAAALAATVCERSGRRRPPRSRPTARGLITVVVGPAHGPPDRRCLLALGDLGVRVRCGEGPPSEHWAVLDRLIREAPTEIVATTTPGTHVRAGWLDDVAATLDGDRVAVAMGGPVGESEDDAEPWLRSRFDLLPRYAVIDRPFAYVAIRRARYVDLGGFDRAVMRFGRYAPPLELAERALDGGLVVVHRGLGELRRDPEPRNPVRRLEWQRQRARGALLARGEAGSGRVLGVVRGAAPLVGTLVRARWRGCKALGVLTAYACGVAEGMVASSGRPPHSLGTSVAERRQAPSVEGLNGPTTTSRS